VFSGTIVDHLYSSSDGWRGDASLIKNLYLTSSLPSAVWSANHFYVNGDFVRPPNGAITGLIYKAISPGLSGNNQPIWGTKDGVIFSDNNVTWQTVYVSGIRTYVNCFF